MGDTEDTTTPAGRYLQQRMNELGYRTKADLADTANVSRSTITRLFKNADYRPDVDVMRRLARGLQVEHDTLVAAIYGDEVATPAGDLHPLAAELGRMLAADSPLPREVKYTLEMLVNDVMDAGRRHARAGGVDMMFTEGEGEQVFIAQLKQVERPYENLPSTGRFLDALTADDSDLDERSQQAIRDGMRALLHLGEQAMIAHAARRDVRHERPVDVPVLDVEKERDHAR